MSFGFSLGDFLATARLINDIIDALRTSSISEFIELTVELENVQRALYEIEHLQPSSGQEAAVNSIKIAALLCKHPLDEFAAKLKKYQGLGSVSSSRKEQLKSWRLKLQWGLTMEEEVQRIRTILSAHMASLNVRLSTQGLTSIAAINDRISQAQKAVIDIRKDVQSQNQSILQGNSYLQSIIRMVQNCMLPQIAALMTIANQVWLSNMQIINLLTRLQHTGFAPDTGFTYFQTPCKFEDAFGRVIPVPAEYDLKMLRGIISARFSAGPGHTKMLAEEYEVFDASDTSQIFSESGLDSFLPGMKLTMAFVIGRYGSQALEECPRPGCRGRTFKKLRSGGQTCSICGLWFDISQRSLPRPFRLQLTEDNFQRIRTERKWNKNVIIHPLDLANLTLDSPPESWIQKGIERISTQLIPNNIEENHREYLQDKLASSIENVHGDPDYPGNFETVAAQAIKQTCEELYLTVDELKNLAANDFEPGTLGIDSLLSFSITSRLRGLGVNPPTLGDGLYLESFIKDFVNEYSYCFKEISDGD